MNKKPLAGYLIVLVLSFLLHTLSSVKTYIQITLPVVLLLYPIITGHKVKINFSIKDIMLGIAIALLILVPYGIAFGARISDLTPYFIAFQFISVAFPEEFFFRGFLQDSMQKSYKSVVLVSLLFASAHLPKTIFGGDWVVLLSFFPSLVMGWFYLKTNNILPGIIFHWLANLTQQSITV
jgi:uncharacterized protein